MNSDAEGAAKEPIQIPRWATAILRNRHVSQKGNREIQKAGPKAHATSPPFWRRRCEKEWSLMRTGKGRP